MRPHLVTSIQEAGSGISHPVPLVNTDKIVLKAENIELVKQGMIDVTLPGGTAASIGAGSPYAIAAKTGTAQVIGVKQNEKYDESKTNERHRDHALFIAYAPADDPKIAVAVIVENGSHGGSTAGPIARKVMDYYLLGKVPVPPAPITPTAAPGAVPGATPATVNAADLPDEDMDAPHD
jgi:penicillin-binding protein 2